MKKRYAVIFSLIISMLLFCGCGMMNDDPSGEAEGADTEGEISKKAEDAPETLLQDKYADISKLPMFDIDLENPFVNGERTLILKDSIDNELEMIAYNHYFYEVAGDYEKGMDLIGENENLRVSTENSYKKKEDGAYIYEYVIKNIRVVEEAELDNMLSFYKEDLTEAIDNYGVNEYAIVEYTISWKYTEALRALGPQLDDETDYLRYLLIATTEEEPEFKIYELYWDDFLGGNISI